MRALAFEPDFKGIAGSHDRSGDDAEGSGFHARPVVHAEHGIHGKQREQAVVYHGFGAAEAFFGGLEDDIYRAGEIPVLGSSEEHTSELQSLMRIPYAVFCLKNKHI